MKKIDPHRLVHAAAVAEIARSVPTERIWDRVRSCRVVHRALGEGGLLVVVKKSEEPLYLLVLFEGQANSRKFFTDRLSECPLHVELPSELYNRFEPLWRNQQSSIEVARRRRVMQRRLAGRIKRREQKRQALDRIPAEERDLANEKKTADIYRNGWRMPGSYGWNGK
jgi:hypothetical protein